MPRKKAAPELVEPPGLTNTCEPSPPPVISHSNITPLNALFIGSSHVRNLNTYLSRKNLHNFDLEFEDFSAHTLGQGGLSIFHSSAKKRFETMLNRVKFMQPDILVVHVGSNDMDGSRYSVHCIVKRLFELLSEVAQFVKVIVISQQFYRKFAGSFNQKVILYNKMVSERCESLPKFLFWHHNGFWNCKEGRYSFLKSDNVHLNDEGNQKFFKSIRFALVHAKQLL